MAQAALGHGNSEVICSDGSKGNSCGTDKWFWNAPSIHASDECSGDVFVNGIGSVRKFDIMESHPDGVPCTSSPIYHSPGLSTYSDTVFINGLNAGRVGDRYDSDGHFTHVISTGSVNVFIDGTINITPEGIDNVFILESGEFVITEDGYYIQVS